MTHPPSASRRTWRHLAMMLLGLGLLTGCQLIKPEQPLDDPVELTPAEMSMSPGSMRPRSDDASADPRDGATSGADARTAGARPALPSRESRTFADLPKTPSLASQMVADPQLLQEQLEVKFNFDADDVPLVVEAFAILLDFRFVVDPAVSGSVTFKLDSSMSREEVWGLLEHILWISGAYLSPADGYVNVLPFSKMPQERRLMVAHRPQPNVAVRLIRAEAIPAANLASALQPFMTAGATATVVPHLNAILLVEAPANLPKLLELTRELDQLGETRWPQISVSCEHVDADTILEELKNIMPILGFPITTGTSAGSGGAGGVKLTALPRLQAIIASAPTQDVLAEVERWVRVLDQAESGEQERIFFYDVKYNNADDISDAVSAFFTGSSTSRSRSSSVSSSGTDGESTTGGASTLSTNATTTRSGKSGSGTSGSAGSVEAGESVFETPVKVFVDGNHNRLVLRTTPRAYAVLEALLTRLDTPPLQVLIQVTIAEIQLSKSTEFGFKYAWQKALSEKYEILPYFDPNGTGTAMVDGGNLLFRSIAQPEQIFGMIQAVAGKGNTRILFSPQIVAINDQEATINAGDEVPVVTQETNTGDSSNITRSIQFRNTGIILTVTPHITSEGMVRMELRQEVSDAVETTSSTIDSPTIRTRSLESTLLVDDGTTLLLGGLITSRDIDNDSGLPYLKDLPKVGHLFKQTSRSNSRQELVLLLTVRVLQRDTDLEGMIKRYKRSVEAIRGSDSNPGKM